ncbi:DUF4145 domain-containing protein [Microbacterium sp. F2]|uniref:DUF4145 domain-containing protein n=1 Tax=Microbacterium sp. F2 TaxID=3422228 RepID=UPI003FD160C3
MTNAASVFSQLSHKNRGFRANESEADRSTPNPVGQDKAAARVSLSARISCTTDKPAPTEERLDDINRRWHRLGCPAQTLPSADAQLPVVRRLGATGVGRIMVNPQGGAWSDLRDTEHWPDVKSLVPRTDFSPTWRAAHCQACGRSSVWRDDQVIYPRASAAPAPHPEMPEPVRALFVEAGEVLSISRRAGAALVRAALERLLRIVAPTSSRAKLDTRIAELKPRVSSSLGELLDVVRFLGNESLHADEDGSNELVFMYLDEAHDAGISELLFDAINDLVDELIARPAQTRELWQKLPEGVRAAIERKKRSDSGS